MAKAIGALDKKTCSQCLNVVMGCEFSSYDNRCLVCNRERRKKYRRTLTGYTQDKKWKFGDASRIQKKKEKTP